MQRQIHIPLRASRRGFRLVKTPGWPGCSGDISADGPAGTARDFGTTPISRMARGAQRGGGGPGRSVEGERISNRGRISRIGGIACLGPGRLQRRHRSSGFLVRRSGWSPQRPHLARANCGRRPRCFGQHVWARCSCVSTVGRDEASIREDHPEATGREKAPRSPDHVWRVDATPGGASSANRFERFTLFKPPALPGVSDYARIRTKGRA